MFLFLNTIFMIPVALIIISFAQELGEVLERDSVTFKGARMTRVMSFEENHILSVGHPPLSYWKKTKLTYFVKKVQAVLS